MAEAKIAIYARIFTAVNMCFKGALNAALFIEFLRRLIKSVAEKVFLIVDNLRVHHSVKVGSGWTHTRRVFACISCRLTHPSTTRTSI